MKIKDLNGREHNWNYKTKKQVKVSKGHEIAKVLLQEIFPFYPLYEEVKMPGTRMYLDFFMPTLKIAIEVQGEQHRTFCKHFHGTRQKFFEQRKRDAEKAEWLQLNGILLIELNTEENKDDWRRAISRGTENTED